ncbi:hypothetical protein EMPS_09638 [Entomortierella parvispora]|uniref:Zn(2)-C6 fungal-type domain-containing protein n=1 Tax=Entomortierella parvispora TaxID=205924 RepID=A0A9P3HID2_9FUNG|nr:hypothetical protein EMPS_09638 [Entomortierella parvispora]
MSTSTLQLMPSAEPGSATDLSQLDPATLAAIPGITYDLKRLKVYSSCLRCRAKKVKCDRKEPCSRCVKHSVECSYRELASVQLDIRQFQRHLNNPKVRKDGAGIITSTATPILTLPSGDTAVLSAGSTTGVGASSPAAASAAAAAVAAATLMAAAAKASSSAAVTSTLSTSTSASPTSSESMYNGAPRKSVKFSSAPTSSLSRPNQDKSAESTDTESDVPAVAAVSSSKAIAMARARVQKMYRKKQVVRQTPFTPPSARPRSFMSAVADNDEEEEEEECEDDDEPIERLVLRDPVDQSFQPTPYSSSSYSHAPSSPDVTMASEVDDEDYDSSNGSSLKKKKKVFNNKDVPIWRAQAVGKHKQTVHEQDLAETFGLAAYLKAKEMSVPNEDEQQDHGMAGQTIDYEYDMELEQALARRMPTFFSRPDRSYSRARKYAQAGYNPALPYARPSHCQLASSTAAGATAPVAAQCCCQIAAKQGQAPGTCYSSGSHDHSHHHQDVSESSMSPPPSSPGQGECTRIAYSPSYQPVSKDDASPNGQHQQEYSSMMPPPPMNPKNASPCSSPRVELAPIYLPKPFSHSGNAAKTASKSDLSAFQVGGGNAGVVIHHDNFQADQQQLPPLKIACKYNEPNVDAWDMIEKPISRTVPVTTKRGRSIKMEMGWILS